MADTRRTAPVSIQADAGIVASDFFVLRTPLLPFEELEAWSSDLEAPAAAARGPEELERALDSDRQRLRGRLRALVRRPEVREALFVASPSLLEGLAAWERDPESGRARGVEAVLVRYFERMTARPTPFGLYAGCSVGRLGPQTRLVLAQRQAYGRHTRLDMHYLCGLADAIGSTPELRAPQPVRPSSSLAPAAGRWRYVEGRIDPETRERKLHLVSVEASPHLDATLARAEGGALPESLAAALTDEEISYEEAEDYIAALIDSQILVPEIEPAVTGPEPLGELIGRLWAAPKTVPMAERLGQAQAALAAMDADGLGLDPERYRSVARTLEDLPFEAKLSRLFQVDLSKPAPEAQLGSRVLAELGRGIELLRRIAPVHEPADLRRFREAFYQRYEGREVPLTEALDEEDGIGFGASGPASAGASPLLDGLDFPEDEAKTSWGRREDYLLSRVQEALRGRQTSIELDARDLAALGAAEAPALPDAFAVTAAVAAASPQDLAQERFRIHLRGAWGPSGANLLGRFCHGDPDLHAQVEKHLRAEEALRPDAVHAEIAHLPQGRLGNVILRPVLRDYEIAYLGRSGAPRERQIPVTDLHVSVRGGRVVLRSKRLDREVLPRLSSAHNFAAADVGVYRFLCTLGMQGVASGLRWSWGALQDAPFLPRVTAGPLVLSLARWRLGKQTLDELGRARGSELYAAVQALREKLGLPRLVALADGDNVLPVDLDNIVSIESFVAVIKQRTEATLTELFAGTSDELCVQGPEGRFVHELVVPFVRKQPRPDPRRPARPAAVRRVFPPGSEWLYAKLYCGPSAADRLLRELARPLLVEALSGGAADRWFFIRYADPHWHLRLRIHGSPERLHAEVLPALQAAAERALGDGSLWKLELGTYEREVERYGGDEGIGLAERLFHADSEAALAIVETLEGDAGTDARWRLALRGMDLLLEALGLGLEARRSVVKRARDSFAREFRVDAGSRRRLAEKFQAQRPSLQELFDPALETESWLAPGLAALRARTEALVPVAAELRAAEAAGRLTAGLSELAASALHMQANRLLRSDARTQELVLYDWLHRLYESKAARLRQGR
jgi:lantibiotic biosynthesis protein